MKEENMNHCKGEFRKLDHNLPCAFLNSGKWVIICGSCNNGDNYKNKNDFNRMVKK